MRDNRLEETIQIDWEAEVKKNSKQAERRAGFLEGAGYEDQAAERERKAREAWRAMSPEERARAEARMKGERW